MDTNGGPLPLIDHEFLEENFRELHQEGEKNLIITIIQRFIETAPERMDLLKSAISDRRAENLRFEAHTLKGRAANLGAKAMAKVCYDLEKLGASGSVESAPSVFSELLLEFKRLVPALAQKAKELEAGIFQSIPKP